MDRARTLQIIEDAAAAVSLSPAALALELDIVVSTVISQNRLADAPRYFTSQGLPFVIREGDTPATAMLRTLDLWGEKFAGAKEAYDQTFFGIGDQIRDRLEDLQRAAKEDGSRSAGIIQRIRERFRGNHG